MAKSRKARRGSRGARPVPVNLDEGDYTRAVAYFGALTMDLDNLGGDPASTLAGLYFVGARYCERHRLEAVLKMARRVGWPPHPPESTH